MFKLYKVTYLSLMHNYELETIVPGYDQNQAVLEVESRKEVRKVVSVKDLTCDHENDQFGKCIYCGFKDILIPVRGLGVSDW